MRARWLPVLAVLIALAPAAALGVDAPHDGSVTIGTCENCHKLHNSSGGTLLNQPDNNTACTACHNASALSSAARLGFPWVYEDQATPGSGGQQHRWDALAENAAFGAARPTDTEMLKRIKDGRIQCAACHDVHADVKALDTRTLHTSIPAATNTAVTGGTGTMVMALTQPTSAANTKGYRVQVLRLGAGSTFELGISHDAATTAKTWVVHNGTSWVTGGTSAGAGLKFWSLGPATVPLDDPAVVLTFSGTPVVGQYWDFYISYAHLRASNVADAMCLQCHASRDQTHTTVGGTGNGTFVFSHPVGQALNANGMGYDRAAANVLDANGALQTTGDGNTTNDLRLDAGLVRCTTCHAVHNADSNSLTVDPR